MPTLNINNLSLEEKMQLVDAIWSNILGASDDIASPDWHLQILRERKELIDSGEETFSPFSEVKQRLNQQLVHA